MLLWEIAESGKEVERESVCEFVFGFRRNTTSIKNALNYLMAV